LNSLTQGSCVILPNVQIWFVKVFSKHFNWSVSKNSLHYRYLPLVGLCVVHVVAQQVGLAATL